MGGAVEARAVARRKAVQIDCFDRDLPVRGISHTKHVWRTSCIFLSVVARGCSLAHQAPVARVDDVGAGGPGFAYARQRAHAHHQPPGIPPSSPEHITR